MEKETEVRFLEIDKDSLVARLRELGAEDSGETMLEEVIIYDTDLSWLAEKRFIRLRRSGGVTKITYKQHAADPKDGAHELEFEISDLDAAIALFEKIGLSFQRRQQKKRHTLRLGEVVFDIDTWPRIPSYVEMEGPTMEVLKEAAVAVGFDWAEVVYEDAKDVIEKRYNIPVSTMRWFTFDRFE
ncbi:MAG: CYTH domain-containing protein [Candidatus Paceibacterota bacterium]|jgi:adenylate cyclase class 2